MYIRLCQIVRCCDDAGNCCFSAAADHYCSLHHIDSVLQLLWDQRDQEAERRITLHDRRVQDAVCVGFQSVGWLGEFSHPGGLPFLPLIPFPCFGH